MFYWFCLRNCSGSVKLLKAKRNGDEQRFLQNRIAQKRKVSILTIAIGWQCVICYI